MEGADSPAALRAQRLERDVRTIWVDRLLCGLQILRGAVQSMRR